jgi:hypothetical protein
MAEALRLADRRLSHQLKHARWYRPRWPPSKLSRYPVNLWAGEAARKAAIAVAVDAPPPLTWAVVEVIGLDS